MSALPMRVEFQRKRLEFPSAQLGSEPMVERWAGRAAAGHYASALVPMAESRKRWGL